MCVCVCVYVRRHVAEGGKCRHVIMHACTINPHGLVASVSQCARAHIFLLADLWAWRSYCIRTAYIIEVD